MSQQFPVFTVALPSFTYLLQRTVTTNYLIADEQKSRVVVVSRAVERLIFLIAFIARLIILIVR